MTDGELLFYPDENTFVQKVEDRPHGRCIVRFRDGHTASAYASNLVEEGRQAGIAIHRTLFFVLALVNLLVSLVFFCYAWKSVSSADGQPAAYHYLLVILALVFISGAVYALHIRSRALWKHYIFEKARCLQAFAEFSV